MAPAMAPIPITPITLRRTLWTESDMIGPFTVWRRNHIRARTAWSPVPPSARPGAVVHVKMRYVLMGLLAAAAAATAMLNAPSASGDCVTSGYATICSQGDVRGDNNPAPSSSGPYWPYPCQDDWLCDTGDLSVIVDPGPPNPGPPDIGFPGRPGNRPGF